MVGPADNQRSVGVPLVNIGSGSAADQSSANFVESYTVNITIEALQVSFSEFSRVAFNQTATDTPLSVNGREFTQDVVDQNDYQDLIDAN